MVHTLTSSNSFSGPGLVIATRESQLALWQAQHVQTRLRRLGHAVELLGMTTQGDQILDRSLSKVGGKGLFVKELETALRSGARTWRCIRSRMCRWTCRTGLRWRA